MRFGIDISPLGEWGSPGSLAELSALAERSGWDGVFLEDYIAHPDGLDAYDPWITLGLIAAATERIAIGLMVTPLPRRRPWKLAAEAVTIDHLSAGRLILGVGIGDPTSADNLGVGEPADPRVRAAMLDEGLEVLDGLWRGEPFTHHGEHYSIDDFTLLPRPVQRPRIPIWIGGQYSRRGPRERALRWDGACLYGVAPPDWVDLTPAQVRALRDRAPHAGYDIAIGGRRRRDDEAAEREYVAAIAEAGATWWHEYLPPSFSRSAVAEHIERGPLG